MNLLLVYVDIIEKYLHIILCESWNHIEPYLLRIMKNRNPQMIISYIKLYAYYKV